MSHLITRRQMLRNAALTATAMAVPAVLVSRMSFAAPAAGEQRFVLVLLRGALDGLAAAPPVGDPDYARRRGTLAMPDVPPLLRLDDLFALHPALGFLGEQWQQQHLTLLHAVATPYRERSHFDAQDVLESGFTRPMASQTGWLNRALAGLPLVKGRPVPVQSGVALGAGVPLVMRGKTEVASWAPSRLQQVEDDTWQRLADLYAGDALLSRRLADAMAAQQLAAGMDAAGSGGGGQLAQTAKTAAAFLVSEAGPRIAVLETTGWDTHANQGREQGALAARLGALDAGLRALQAGLGSAWDQTVVLVATEFGRTVAVNGTSGTDHGTGAAAFLVGGAVRGRVVADWPGLADSALYQGRDLAPTLDLRTVVKSVMRDHLHLDPGFLGREVFPDSGKLPWLDGLV